MQNYENTLFQSYSIFPKHLHMHVWVTAYGNTHTHTTQTPTTTPTHPHVHVHVSSDLYLFYNKMLWFQNMYMYMYFLFVTTCRSHFKWLCCFKSCLHNCHFTICYLDHSMEQNTCSALLFVKQLHVAQRVMLSQCTMKI